MSLYNAQALLINGQKHKIIRKNPKRRNIKLLN